MKLSKSYPHIKHILNELTAGFALIACIIVIIWHSIYIVIAAKFNRLNRNKVNQRIRKGAARLLNLIDAKPNIRFAPGFNMQKDVPYIFMANHLSLFDLPLLYAMISGTTRFLVKKSLFNVPIFGKAITQAEFIPVDMSNPEEMSMLFANVKQKLQTGMRLFIFPEGTRSRTGVLGAFKSGGFRLAREVGATIIPIGIKGTYQALPPKSFSLKRGQHLSVHVGHPIDSSEYKDIESQKLLMERVAGEIKALCNGQIE